MNVSSILRRKGTHVETAREPTTLGAAAQRLTAENIGSLVVLDNAGSLLGVLCERDLVCGLSLHGQSAWNIPIGDLVSHSPATCKPEDSLADVMSIMTRRRARHVPVMAGEALVGIVSIGDVVKCQLDDLRIEVGVLRDNYVARGGAR